MSCRKVLPLIVLVASLLAPLAVLAQVSPQGLLSAEGARRAGLTRMWFTQLEMDSSRGRVQGLTQHVSSIHGHTVFEVMFRGRSYVFSERDLDAFGNPVGVAGAKEAAEKKVAQLNLLLGSPATAAPKEAPPAVDAATPPAATDAPAAAPPPADAPAAAPSAVAAVPAVPPVVGAAVMLMHVIPDITIYATSERGLVHAIDGETGKTRWATAVGDPRFPTSNSGASDDVVAVFNGSKVYVLKASDGTVSWEKSIPGAPVYGPAISEDFIFMPLLAGMVEGYQVNYPKRAAATFKAMGRPTTQPVILNRSIAWATDRGHVYVGSATDAKMKFRVETKGVVLSPPSYLPPDKLFITSQDGYVYCVHESRGGIAWKFSAGESMTYGPIGVRDTVYAIADSGTLYSIDAELGTEKWTTSGIRGFIAAATDRIYLTDINGSLVVIDSRSGSRVALISAPELEVRMINTETDRIIVGTPSGLLQCFRELDRKWPDIRLTLDGGPRKPAQKSGEKKEEAGKAKPAATEETKPAEDDPFAKPAAGAAKKPAAEKMPPAGEKPAEADPFAGDKK